VRAVALVGTAAPPWLPQAASRRVVTLDADAAGDRAAAGLTAALASFARSVERLRPPSGKDWHDALLADYGELCAVLEACGLVTAGAVDPAAASAPAPPDRGQLAVPGGAVRR
jgi:hypothetical protein